MSKAIRVLGIIAVMLIAVIVGAILVLDPPPLQLREPDQFFLSVPPPPTLDSLQHSIDNGLGCKQKLETYMSNSFGRPVITLFDWLRDRISGQLPERDVHLEISKPNNSWAVKVDRASKAVCFLMTEAVKVGVTDAYCGTKIIHEDATRIVAFEDIDHSLVRVIFFDKQTYTLTMTELGENRSSGMIYFECY